MTFSASTRLVLFRDAGFSTIWTSEPCTQPGRPTAGVVDQPTPLHGVASCKAAHVPSTTLRLTLATCAWSAAYPSRCSGGGRPEPRRHRREPLPRRRRRRLLHHHWSSPCALNHLQLQPFKTTPHCVLPYQVHARANHASRPCTERCRVDAPSWRAAL